MGRAIFISYRRDDSEGEAGRLFDDLVRAYGNDSVFMDVSGIDPGADFRRAIDENVSSCGVLLAIIGPEWCSMRNQDGTRRLDDPNDFVRLEIASALARNVAVIPVLVHDAKMPRPEDLPDNLKELSFRNNVELTHARWNSDVQLLTHALARYVAPAAASDSQPVHATVGVQLPPPAAPSEEPRSSRPSSLPLAAGVVAAVVLALGVVAFLMFRPHPDPNPAPASSPLIGTWVNPGVRQIALDKLEIATNGAHGLSIHAWARCAQEVCDWGLQNAVYDGKTARATWHLQGDAGVPAPGRTASLTLTPDAGGVSVTIDNTFSDRPPNQGKLTFVHAK